MNININTNLLATLTRLAEQESMLENNKELYIEKLVENHLLANYRSEIINKISNKKLEDLVTMETAVTEISDAIAMRDEAPIDVKPIDIVPELPMDNGTTTPVI